MFSFSINRVLLTKYDVFTNFSNNWSLWTTKFVRYLNKETGARNHVVHLLLSQSVKTTKPFVVLWALARLLFNRCFVKKFTFFWITPYYFFMKWKLAHRMSGEREMIYTRSNHNTIHNWNNNYLANLALVDYHAAPNAWPLFCPEAELARLMSHYSVKIYLDK